MHRSSFLFSCVSVLLAAGCSSTTTAGPGGPDGIDEPGTPGTRTASKADIDRCKQLCNKMKFFGCSSADEQARCYADCDSASASQIEVFNGCANSSVCDPECRTSIEPAESEGNGSGSGGAASGTGAGGSAGSGGAGAGGGATAASCTTACNKLVSCSLIPLSAKGTCNARCADEGYQYQIDCAINTPCDQIASACGGVAGGGGPVTPGGGGVSAADVTACQTQCDSINFFECASVAQHSQCRAECTTAAAAARETFTSCARSSGGECERKAACLTAFLN